MVIIHFKKSTVTCGRRGSLSEREMEMEMEKPIRHVMLIRIVACDYQHGFASALPLDTDRRSATSRGVTKESRVNYFGVDSPPLLLDQYLGSTFTQRYIA